MLECDLGTATVAASSDAWSTIDVGEPPLPLEQLDREVERLTTELDAPMLAVYVETSDFGYVSASEAGDGIVLRAVVNASAADGFQEGSWALARAQSMYGRSWKATPARQLVEWSRHAPRRVASEQAKRLIYRNHLFPEDAIEEVFNSLGLPIPDVEGDVQAILDRLRLGEEFEEALFLSAEREGWVSGLRVDFGRHRFVAGFGEDFLGIWDREQAGPPIRRYPRSEEGAAYADAEWLRLNLGEIGRFKLWLLRAAAPGTKPVPPPDRKRL